MEIFEAVSDNQIVNDILVEEGTVLPVIDIEENSDGEENELNNKLSHEDGFKQFSLLCKYVKQFDTATETDVKSLKSIFNKIDEGRVNNETRPYFLIF